MFSSLPKKAAGRLCSALLCFTLVLGAFAGSAQAVSTVTAQLRPDLTIMIDGSKRVFYNVNAQQVHPILYNGTTYLPVRAIGELMGKVVDWNQDTRTVTLSGTRTTPNSTGIPDAGAVVQNISAELRDDFTIIVDGTTRTFADVNGKTVYPMLYNGSTYLPLRAIGMLMGKQVTWDQNTKTATLSGGLVTDADTFSGTGVLTVEEAKSKALAHAGLTSPEATFTKQKLDWEDGRQVYEFKFRTNDNREYECELDAITGKILSYKCVYPSTPSATASITQDQAREIALSRVPGASAIHVSKLKLDWDDGILIYEVEIIYNAIEYEFEIDANKGVILKYESESVYD